MKTALIIICFCIAISLILRKLARKPEVKRDDLTEKIRQLHEQNNNK